MAQQTIGSILKARAAPLITCRADDTVQMVVGLLHRHSERLPVVDAEGHLVGIVSGATSSAAWPSKDGVRKSKVSVLMTKDVVTCTATTAVRTQPG